MLLDVVGLCWMLLDIAGWCWMLLDVVGCNVMYFLHCSRKNKQPGQKMAGTLSEVRTHCSSRTMALSEACTTRRCKGGGGGNMHQKYMHMQRKEEIYAYATEGRNICICNGRKTSTWWVKGS